MEFLALMRGDRASKLLLSFRSFRLQLLGVNNTIVCLCDRYSTHYISYAIFV